MRSIFSIPLVQWLLKLPGRASYGDSSGLTATSVIHLCLRAVCLKSLILKIQLLSGTLQVTRTGSFLSLPPPCFNLCQFSAPCSLSPSQQLFIHTGALKLICVFFSWESPHFLSLCCFGHSLPAACTITTSLLSLLCALCYQLSPQLEALFSLDQM